MLAVTYNIHHGLDMAGKFSLQRIQTLLGQLQPDLVFLQEVDRCRIESGLTRQAEQLARSLDMAWIYGVVNRYAVGSYGNAVLTNYPIHSVTNHLLPDIQDARRCLQVDVQVGEKCLSLFNTHLGLHFTDRMRHLQDIILPLVAAQNNSVILAGDFNCSPDSPEVSLCKKLLQDSADCLSGSQPFTYPSDQPNDKMDYIFLSQDCQALDCYVLTSDASDHLPLVNTYSPIPA